MYIYNENQCIRELYPVGAAQELRCSTRTCLCIRDMVKVMSDVKMDRTRAS
jgi:hypothetical protein